MRILGVDTSLTATGLARIDTEVWAPLKVLELPEVVPYDVATATVGAPKPTKDKSKRAMVRRVNALLKEVEWCFKGDDRPDYVGLESLAYGAKGEGAWVLPWIFGRVLELCETYDVPLQVVGTTARAKFATGNGRADKETVLLAAVKLFADSAEPKNNNEADALIVGAVVCQKLGIPILPVTKYRAEVVAGLGD